MKNWIKNFFTDKKAVHQDNEPFPIVWDNSLISIYQFLLPYKDADKLPETAQTLPDESSNDSELKWSAGAMDGVMNHHVGAPSEQNCVEQIIALLTTISAQPNKNDIEQLYTLIKTQGTLSFIDDLNDAIIKVEVDFDNLYKFIYWLATNSPDREIVKFSIAVLGRFTAEQTELFLLLGMHEEFTLFSAVALQNTLSSPEKVESALLTLAKKVHGWGRIHLVERLASNPSQEVKNWLLREGYRNSVMYEYLAYTCATAGELNQVLEHDVDDLPLLICIGEILEALIMGGPAEDMHDYNEGATVCLNYVKQLVKLPSLVDLSILSSVLIIRDFVNNMDDESYPNWDEKTKNEIIAKANDFIQQDKWLALVKQDLVTPDSSKFWLAADLYTQLGFDAWDARFDHQKNHHSDQWFYLMKTDDRSRIEQVITLAKQQNDFSLIATGPALEHGLGMEYQVHSVLDFILQELNRFSGIGEDLILIGLNSPVIRNRNMALNAIEGWDRQIWSTKLKNELEKLAKIEPDEEIKQRVIALLNDQNS